MSKIFLSMQNFNHLYYFFVVAKLKSVTAAALFLHTSQPSLSTQIKTLEKSLKRQLFIKRGRYLELTTEGTRIFRYCSKMFEIYYELEKYIRADKETSEINIGFSQEIFRPFTAHIVSQGIKNLKSVDRPKVKMTSVAHESLMEQLKAEKIDFALSNIECTDAGIETIRHFSMPVVLLATEHMVLDLGIKKSMKQDEVLNLAAQSLALPSEHLKLRIETEEFLNNKKIAHKSIIETDNLTSMVRVTLENLTFSILPKPYVFREIQNDLLVNLTPGKGLWMHHLYLMTRKDTKKNRFISKLCAEIEHLL